MPKTFQARVITCQVKGFRPQRLITSLLDPEKYPAKEVSALYHERWEIELGFDEIKTRLLEREEALRSRKPDGVRQELAGIGIAYNLVRVEMARVATELGIEPTRLSFRHSLMLIRNFCLAVWATSPGAIPRRPQPRQGSRPPASPSKTARACLPETREDQDEQLPAQPRQTCSGR